MMPDVVRSRAFELGPAVRRPRSLDEENRNKFLAAEAERRGNRDLAEYYLARNAKCQPSHPEYVAGLEAELERLRHRVALLGGGQR